MLLPSVSRYDCERLTVFLNDRRRGLADPGLVCSDVVSPVFRRFTGAGRVFFAGAVLARVVFVAVARRDCCESSCTSGTSLLISGAGFPPSINGEAGPSWLRKVCCCCCCIAERRGDWCGLMSSFRSSLCFIGFAAGQLPMLAPRGRIPGELPILPARGRAAGELPILPARGRITGLAR